jgi:hypothetical protein
MARGGQLVTIAQYRPADTTDHPAHNRWIELMAPAVELANNIRATGFVPKAMRNNAPEIAAAILYGDEVGLGPMVSLAKIAVVDGRPSLAAEAQRALILGAGHRIWPLELTVTRATWAGQRHGDDVVTQVTWSMDDARRAGLTGKPNWRAYPRQMLSARASAELARAVFADVIGGLAATEELEDLGEAEAGEAGAGVITASAEPTAKRRRRPATKAATPIGPPTEPTPPPEPPLPGEEGHETASRGQLNRMMGLYGRRNLGGTDNRAARLAHASAIVGRDLKSSNELTADEAQKVIDALDAEPVIADVPLPLEEPPL